VPKVPNLRCGKAVGERKRSEGSESRNPLQHLKALSLLKIEELRRELLRRELLRRELLRRELPLTLTRRSSPTRSALPVAWTKAGWDTSQ
jgi:hypothetical protein